MIINLVNETVHFIHELTFNSNMKKSDINQKKQKLHGRKYISMNYKI